MDGPRPGPPPPRDTGDCALDMAGMWDGVGQLFGERALVGCIEAGARQDLLPSSSRCCPCGPSVRRQIGMARLLGTCNSHPPTPLHTAHDRPPPLDRKERNQRTVLRTPLFPFVWGRVTLASSLLSAHKSTPMPFFWRACQSATSTPPQPTHSTHPRATHARVCGPSHPARGPAAVGGWARDLG